MKYTRYCPSTINRETHPHLSAVSKCWQTEDGKYDILFDEVGVFKHLRVSRIDDQPIHDFMDMQEIKNDLWGEDVIAVEVYPRQIDFKNGSNTYHLWTWDNIAVPNLAQLYKYKYAPQEYYEGVAVQQATAQACQPQKDAASTH
jgi:hypothetical protein